MSESARLSRRVVKILQRYLQITFNGARAAKWGSDYFITAEDLTRQAGLGVQQDTALVAFHGLTHAERNGHHYVDGSAETPEPEAQAFLTAHPDLYEQNSGNVRLSNRDRAIRRARPRARICLRVAP